MSSGPELLVPITLVALVAAIAMSVWQNTGDTIALAVLVICGLLAIFLLVKAFRHMLWTRKRNKEVQHGE